METKRLNKYGLEVCQAYKEVAGHKWGVAFECRKCGHDTYFEGKTPYSRRCSKCKKDESATANTMFDKLKFSLPVALDIIKEIIRSDVWLKSTVATTFIEQAKGIKFRQQTMWDFLDKIYQAMIVREIVYEEEVLYVTFLKKNQRILVSKGILDGKEYYAVGKMATRWEKSLPKTITSQTNEKTKVAVFIYDDIKNVDLKRRNLKVHNIAIENRAILFINDELQKCAAEIVKDIWHWIAGDHYNLYSFKKNSNDYSDLMKLLIRDSIPKKTT